MNEMQIFSKPEFGRIGALTADDGTPWFNAVDVCKALDLKNPSQALKDNVDEADLRITETRSGGQVRKVNFVNESPVTKPDGTTFTAYTTMVTGSGQIYFVNAFVHMTEQELEELKDE